MNKRRWLCVVVCATVACTVALSWCARSTSSAKPAAAAVAVEPPPLLPKVVVDEEEYDFGFLDPSESIEHSFVIRNEGKGPLRLERGGTSCTCTMSHLPSQQIPPGGTVEVRVSTKHTATRDGTFSHTANIRTNDPDQKVIRFVVKGVYRTFLAAKPERLVFPRPAHDDDVGKPIHAEVTLFSQVFDGFDLSNISSTLKDVRWEVRPLSSEELEPLEARSGYRITVHMPEDLPKRGFSEMLHISAIPAEKAHNPRTLAIPLTRPILRAMYLFGPDLTRTRVLQLGTIVAGTSRRTTVTLKVAVEPRVITVKNITVEPDFVRVRMEPMNPDTPQLGLYRINVEIPDDAPMCNHMGVAGGRIKIETNHPELDPISLHLQFAVTGI